MRFLTSCVVTATLGSFLVLGSSAASHTYTSLDDWIVNDALQVPADPREFDSAIDRVIARIDSSVELLGFGEALHGGEDVLRLRNRLFQRLVKTHGYRAIAIETGSDAAEPVDEYIAGRGPSSYEGLLDSAYGRAFGRLEANRDLIEWMRQYNADPSHQAKLRFYGIDLSAGQSRIGGPAKVLGLAIDYLATIDTLSGEGYRQRFGSLLEEASGWEEAWTDSSKSPALKPIGASLRIATEDLITELRARRPELVAKSSEDLYLIALHHALVARQVLDLHAALAVTVKEPPHGTGLRGVRDALMADNLTYVVAREHDRGKVFVFAHNQHLQRGWAVWPCCGQKYAGSDIFAWWPAGSQLSDMMGSKYMVIGTAVGVSDEKNGIGEPEPGTLEARLVRRPGPVRFIPTNGGRGLPPGEIATLPTRSGSLKNLSYAALTPQSFTDFDWLAVIDSTVYVRELPQTPSHR